MRLFIYLSLFALCYRYGVGLDACDRTRKVLTQLWGTISDGGTRTNYSTDSHCEWLIKANSSEQFITLKFQSLVTECSYDYIYVYDGDSFASPMLGSFSGKTRPQNVVATSGFMLILLYSDTNYVLDGFEAEYSITECRSNCSGHGVCAAHRCICEREWGGLDCSQPMCPDSCSRDIGGGHCEKGKCICNPGFSGLTCSLNLNDTAGNKWHILYKDGMSARAGHSAVYLEKFDSLYVFGGYDLNYVLGDLLIFRFNTSQWEDDQGRVQDAISTPANHLDSHVLHAVLGKVWGDENDTWGIRRQTFLHHALLSVAANNSLALNGNHFDFEKRNNSQHLRATKHLRAADVAADEEDETTMAHPSARYSHAVAPLDDGFALFGGRLEKGVASNELWFYNATANRWSLRAVTSNVRPPPLARHTLTEAKGWLYVMGGSKPDGVFSSDLYRIKLVPGGGDAEQWEIVHTREGKPLDLRLVGHSTVYSAIYDSLIVYGGLKAKDSRTPKLTDSMYMYSLSTMSWARINYPKSQHLDQFTPLARAFHTSTLIGNYLVVFGGYAHEHKKDEICYDNKIYLYHLGCHVWVSQETLGQSGSGRFYPKKQGVFSHAAAVRNRNTLILVGGYHGNVNADLLAYVFPQTIAGKEGDSHESESMCSRHHGLSECTLDPECGWCSADETCYGRTLGVNCTTNLQTTRCPGICPTLWHCHSCLLHSPAASLNHAQSVAYKLDLYKCNWCVQNARCHHVNDNFGTCGTREDAISHMAGWWGEKGVEITNADDCIALDKRPGLTFTKYLPPANYSQPDFVSIINSTQRSLTEFGGGFSMGIGEPPYKKDFSTTRLQGFIHPPQSWSSGVPEYLSMCSVYASASLSFAYNSSSLELVGNMSTDAIQCRNALWQNGEAVLLPFGRHRVDFKATKLESKKADMIPYSAVQLQHRTQGASSDINKFHDSKVFTFEYLEPYEGLEPCISHSNCLACLSDSKCGWCSMQSKCYERTVNQSEVCRGDSHWEFLKLEPSTCENCSNFVTCDSCIGSGICEWRAGADFAKCHRINRFSTAIRKVSECPMPCHLRDNCSQCLDGFGGCVWCHSSQECFSFLVYTSQYQFGMCREWSDQKSVPEPNSLPKACKSCSMHPNCSTCLQHLGCGWCYDVDNPIVGVCAPGDFSQPNVEDSCSVEVNRAHHTSLYEDEAAWSYAQCPDVDECGLGLHDCHTDAKCTNTHGSYNCQCKRGFIGDGKTSCKKTCYNKCVHGTCSNEPDYVCHCDLGWTGLDCSTNCGCNNHSTCSRGVNICDECLNWTSGEFCQFCKPGSFGNATSLEGCKRCNCNDHGDKDFGICDSATGVCVCQDNTEGPSCDKCKKGFYGDPRRGGTCYYQCMARGMMSSLKPQGLGSRLAEMSVWELRQGPPPTRECLWIVSPTHLNQSQTSGGIIQLEIDRDIDVGCTENSVYVYDGLPKFVSSSGNRPSHVLGVFCTQDTQYPVTVQAKSGVMTVHYKAEGDSKGGFNATVFVLSCPDNCPNERVCLKGSCVCPEGTTGHDCQDILCPNNCSAHLNQGHCDKDYGRCVCASGWGGANCSSPLDPDHQVVFAELFNSAHLSDQYEHLRKMLPRFGHSLLADRRSSLWLFGGYSLSHGPLNDIRLFDTINNTWVQVTIDSTNDANMPRGRYFHAAAISLSRREIFVHGGLTETAAGTGDQAFGGGEHPIRQNSTLNDFWKFSLKNSHWIAIETPFSPPGLAGHTLTLRRDEESETLILIGGFSTVQGFLSSVWEFDPVTDQWAELETAGYGPIGVYGHSTVYHEPTQSFYVFGGYVYGVNRTHISSRLFAFHYPSRTWSALPTFAENNPPRLNVPRARFLHSAVTTNDYMLVFGGKTESGAGPESLVAYLYRCNHWIRLLSKGIKVVGKAPPVTYAHSMTLDVESSNGNGIVAYVMGGFTGSTESRVTRISLPADLCSLGSTKDKCRSLLGCSFCSVSNNGITNSSHCYATEKKLLADPCQTHNGTLRTSNGVMCDFTWMAARLCEPFNSCADCLARWPSQWDSPPICKWCSKCGGDSGKCVPASKDFVCAKEKTCREIHAIEQCPELSCRASDCDKCSSMGDCAWTRQVMKTSEEGGVTIAADPLYDWTCVEQGLSERSSFKIRSEPACPRRCSQHMDCQTCLQSQGGEGDWHECRWSTRLGECISPSYQSIVCAGGVCGLVLSRGALCPQPCNTFTQCSECLAHAQCGWCALQSSNSTGQGVCSEGSLDQPSEGPEEATCDALYAAKTSATATTDIVVTSSANFSWHYVTCPPENECANNHHNCDATSEMCVDTQIGYDCICGPGYKLAEPLREGDCIPVCTQGCVRGRCTAPDTCTCDFGYVGANCSIQCQCNGHSHCAGPDKLDECLECHNNTQGPTCNRCLPLFVGEPTDNGECIPCSEYCNNHTDICVNETITDFHFIYEATREELASILGEGPTTKARCIGCKSNTTGAKCEDCLKGHFRGSEDHRVPCRPCVCHGHGHTCNTVTGEGCDCHNNTESDPKLCIEKGNCWEHQCTKCKESYSGMPTEGHQCYKHMSYDLRFNLGGRQTDEADPRPIQVPLNPGQGAFFAVHPRFVNVDIRITVDVTRGNLDLYLAPREDAFVVELNRSVWTHEVKLDPRYYDNGDHIGEIYREEPFSSSHTSYHHNSKTVRIDRKIEKIAQGLSTYTTVYRHSHLLVVKNVTNRLVITLPNDRHDFSQAKFFIILLAVDKHSYGAIYFRQDQLHIDLFVFFSVFFSCFFLFLAACVVAWKAKQAADMRRARRRHVVEMLHMAKRPFATVSVLVDHQSACDIQVRPVALEPTYDGLAAVGTLIVRLPGGKAVPTRLAMASALVLVGRSNSHGRAFLRRRSDYS
ncbi:Plexin repeat [Nesidiocoris tenuis]|uniref:Plexin repeat n=1 Tax=Nesidiocoris tenuis TaxID=355587 RepID=A0ABN7A9S5_9HEMI|nr:Plexin repeat [Nesidiocoris tenuis]